MAEMDFMREAMTIMADKMARGDAAISSTLMAMFDNNALFPLSLFLRC